MADPTLLTADAFMVLKGILDPNDFSHIRLHDVPLAVLTEACGSESLSTTQTPNGMVLSLQGDGWELSIFPFEIDGELHIQLCPWPRNTSRGATVLDLLIPFHARADDKLIRQLKCQDDRAKGEAMSLAAKVARRAGIETVYFGFTLRPETTDNYPDEPTRLGLPAS